MVMKYKIIIILLIVNISSILAESIQDSYALEAKGEYLKALKIMEKIVEKDNRNYFINLRCAYLSYLSYQFPKSEIYYQKAILLAPDAIEPRLGQLKPLSALGKQVQLQVACKGILKLDPKNYTARSYIAYSLYTSGNYEEAEKYYASLIIDYPSDTEMLIGLGWTYVQLKDKKKAREILAIANQITPADERIKNGLFYSKE